jgi:gamma-glutamylcyclotransferase (GGCT)/AIG2-like uncharacterized protein YtfP
MEKETTMTTNHGNGTRTHRVFVYGTLLQGCHNNRVLTSAGATFIARATVRGVRLVDAGWGFPGALPKLDLRCRAHGEVYEVNDRGLRRLDQLEGVPRFYTRRTILTSAGEAWIYILAPGTARRWTTEGSGSIPVARNDWRAHQAGLSACYDPARRAS